MSRIPCAVAVLVLAAASAPAAAQSAPDSVQLQLREAAAEAGGRGFRTEPRVFDARATFGLLPRGGVVVLEASLRAGVRYTVVGVCDAHCLDLDLLVHAPGNGDLLDRDVNTDEVPVVTFEAPENGSYPITVVMSDCREELCRFGVKVLAR